MSTIVDRRSSQRLPGADPTLEETVRRWASEAELRDSLNPDERAMWWLSVYAVNLLARIEELES